MNPAHFLGTTLNNHSTHSEPSHGFGHHKGIWWCPSNVLSGGGKYSHETLVYVWASDGEIANGYSGKFDMVNFGWWMVDFITGGEMVKFRWLMVNIGD